MGSNPSQPVTFAKSAQKSIDTKLKLRGLSDRTIETYLSCYRIFTKFIHGRTVTQDLIEEYLLNNGNRRNNLSLLRLLYPEFTKDIPFPKRQYKPKILPSKTALKQFYDALPDKYKPIFLLLSESGLRISELLDCKIDTVNQMLIPNGHIGQTKHSWISFYVTVVESIPKFNQDSVSHAFKKTSKICGVTVYPHLLRSVFSREASLGGMPSHYIDAFCGRIPQSVLSRCYTDYSPETLKSIYSKARISIL